MSYTNHQVAVLLEEARKQERKLCADSKAALLDALSGLLAYAEEGCPEGGYACIIEARAALNGLRVVQSNAVGQSSGDRT